jgi:hypothetical protein
VIRTGKGLSKGDGVGEAHPGVRIEGVFQGERDGFGFLNPSYPGPMPLKLERGKPLLLRRRGTLFRGAAPNE